MRIRTRSHKPYKEKGNAIDLLSSMVVIFFMFAILLGYLCYSNAIRQKMMIDMAAKNALYQMEETGQWTDDIKTNFLNELKSDGLYVTGFACGSEMSNGHQVQYGDQVTFHCIIEFNNPARRYKFMNMFTPEKITYEILRRTTAKW